MKTLHYFFFIIFQLNVLNLLCYSQTDSLRSSGIASFYHDKFHGLETSSGEDFNMHDFTAAHRTLPFGTLVHVTNKLNNKSVVVRINDRGPFKKSRIIDLTRSAAMKLDMVPFGIVPVKIKVLNLLDEVTLNDSTLNANDMKDCFGNDAVLSGFSILAWSSKSIKHLFYMASDLLMDLRLSDLFVKAIGEREKRKYQLIISGIKTRQEALELVKLLKKDGFRFARIL